MLIRGISSKGLSKKTGWFVPFLPTQRILPKPPNKIHSFWWAGIPEKEKAPFDVLNKQPCKSWRFFNYQISSNWCLAPGFSKKTTASSFHLWGQLNYAMNFLSIFGSSVGLVEDETYRNSVFFTIQMSSIAFCRESDGFNLFFSGRVKQRS